MRNTQIIMKDGSMFCAPIERQEIDCSDFGKSYIKLFFCSEKLYVRDMASAKTKLAWISCTETGDVDELERMRREYERERRQ